MLSPDQSRGWYHREETELRILISAGCVSLSGYHYLRRALGFPPGVLPSFLQTPPILPSRSPFREGSQVPDCHWTCLHPYALAYFSKAACSCLLSMTHVFSRVGRESHPRVAVSKEEPGSCLPLAGLCSRVKGPRGPLQSMPEGEQR